MVKLSQELVFVLTKPTFLFDKIDANYSHPERVNTVKKLEKLEKNGIVKIRRLSTLVKFEKSRTSELDSKILPCIEMRDVDMDYGLIKLRHITVGDAGTSITECHNDEILFSRIRPYLNKVVLVPPTISKAICSGEFFVCKSIDKKIPIGYLWLMLRSEFVLNQSKHLPTGSLRPRLDEDDLADLLVPILKDENAMTEINEGVMTALKTYYSAFTKINTLEKSFFSSLNLSAPIPTPELFFTFAKQPSDSPRSSYRIDPLFFHPSYYELLKKQLNKWASENNGKLIHLKDLAIKNGVIRWKSKVNNPNGNIPRFGVDNITGSGISWDCNFVDSDTTQPTILHRNDILITSTGTGSTGRIDIFDEDLPAITDGHITVVRLQTSVNPYYVLAYLHSEYAKRQLLRMERGTSGQIEIYADDIENMLIPYSNDKKIIERSANEMKEVSTTIRKSKKILRIAMCKIDAFYNERKFGDDKLDVLDTTTPKQNWRISR